MKTIKGKFIQTPKTGETFLLPPRYGLQPSQFKIQKVNAKSVIILSLANETEFRVDLTKETNWNVFTKQGEPTFNSRTACLNNRKEN